MNFTNMHIGKVNTFEVLTCDELFWILKKIQNGGWGKTKRPSKTNFEADSITLSTLMYPN